MSAAITATGLGKRYRQRWALRECTLEIPEGRVAGLVGPNGAGKTTLLHLATGLLEPTAGTVSVFGLDPRVDAQALPVIGFVGQEVPLYRTFTVGDMLSFGRHLNPSWDDQLARSRLDRLDIPLRDRVDQLSGGQRAQLALAVALAKRPRVLLLDEPLASLDPLARREFLQTLMESVAGGDVTVLLSSHLVADLERVCDYLIVLARGHTQVVGEIDQLLRTHKVLTGLPKDIAAVGGVASVVQETTTERQTMALVRTDGPVLDPGLTQESVGLEDLVLAYLGQPAATALPQPRLTPLKVEVSR